LSAECAADEKQKGFTMNTINTTYYMVLGTAAVFLPLLLYTVSLYLQTRRVRKKLEEFEE